MIIYQELTELLNHVDQYGRHIESLDDRLEKQVELADEIFGDLSDVAQMSSEASAKLTLLQFWWFID